MKDFIELGKVSEETKGTPGGSLEGGVSPSQQNP